MIAAIEWVKVRATERLEILLDTFASVSGLSAKPGYRRLTPEELDQRNVHGFLIAQVALLQARCDLLDAQVESMQETRH